MFSTQLNAAQHFGALLVYREGDTAKHIKANAVAVTPIGHPTYSNNGLYLQQNSKFTEVTLPKGSHLGKTIANISLEAEFVFKTIPRDSDSRETRQEPFNLKLQTLLQAVQDIAAQAKRERVQAFTDENLNVLEAVQEKLSVSPKTKKEAVAARELVLLDKKEKQITFNA
jgi:hypothetical protein